MKFDFKVYSKIKEAWPMYKKHFGAFILLISITLAFQFIVQGNHGYDDNIFPILVAYILNIVLSFVWIRSMLNLIDNGNFSPFSKESLPTLSEFWDFTKTLILSSLIILGGFVLLIIPGFYFAGRLMFVQYLSVEKKQGARKNISESWNITKGYGWKIFWKSFVIGLFAILGFIALFVGSLITYPLAMIVTAMLYREFFKFKMSEVTEIIKEATVEVKEIIVEGKIEEEKKAIEESI